MKKLVVTLSFILCAFTAVSQEKDTTEANVTTTSDSTKVETVKISSELNTTTISSVKTTRILLESDFNKATLLFRGKKSKREKLC